MRAGPLANPKVIALLNSYFVCAYTSNNAASGDPDADKREQTERQRIFQAFADAKLGTGEVSPYILTWDARPLGRLSIGPALEKDNRLHLLEKTVADLKLSAGEAVVKPAPQSAPPKTPAGSLVLHLTARKLNGHGSWNEFPSEDWIVLSKEQQGKLLPADPPHAGDSWDIDRDTAARILTHFFPQTETTTPSEEVLLSETGPHKHRIERQTLKGRVLTVEKGIVRARLEGSVRLRHLWGPRSKDGPDGIVEAPLLGFLEWDARTKKIASLRLVTDKAKYGATPIGVAVRSLP
jgi:hypothetical protein